MECFKAKYICLSVICWKVCTYLLLKIGDEKSIDKKWGSSEKLNGWQSSFFVWNFVGSNEWILTNAWIKTFKISTSSGGLWINPSSS